MKFSGLSITVRVALCLATGLLATALILSAVLVAGDQFADGASKRTQKRTALLRSSHKPGATQQTKAGFLLQGEQNGQTSKRGDRPMGIIAILVGLKADQGYAFRFSTVGCRSGEGGGIYNTSKSGGTLVGRAISLTSTLDGTAYLERNYRLTRKVFRKTKTVVLLEKGGGGKVAVCASRGDTTLGDVTVVRE